MFINRQWLTNALANSNTEQAFLHGCTLTYSLVCPDVFFHFSAITNINKQQCDHARLYLSGWFLVWSCSSSPMDWPLEDSLKNTFSYSIFGCSSIRFSFRWCMSVLCTFTSFSVSLDLVWQPGSLINMDGTISFNGLAWG